jgi:hypothetical protein
MRGSEEPRRKAKAPRLVPIVENVQAVQIVYELIHDFPSNGLNVLN